MGGLKLTFRLGSKNTSKEREDSSPPSPKLYGKSAANHVHSTPNMGRGTSRLRTVSSEPRMIAKAEVPQLQPRERRGRHAEDVKLGLGEPKATFMRGVPRALGGSGGVVRIAQGGIEDGKHNNKRRALSLAQDGLSPPRIPEPQSPNARPLSVSQEGHFFKEELTQ